MGSEPEGVDWVQYRPGAGLVWLLSVPASVELAHRRLTDYHWSTGRWVTLQGNQGPELCRLDRGAWRGAVASLRKLGWTTLAGALIHRGVQRTRCTALTSVRTHRAISKAGAKRRWEQERALARTSAAGSADGMPEARAGGLPAASPVKTVSKSPEETRADTLKPEPSMRSGSVRKKVTGAEKDFMRDVVEMYEGWRKGSSKVEMTNWGGWWRNRHRESATKAQAVLADVRSMVKEGTVRVGPGQAAVDLWGRLP